jgi:flavodoxin
MLYPELAVEKKRFGSMKALLVYDSQFGNTKRVAEAIGEALAQAGEVTVARVGETEPGQLADLDLLVVGSPTQRFNPTPAAMEFLKGIPAGALQGTHVAAFDTRFTVEKIEEIRILAFFVRLFGYAAEKIARQLKAKGGTPATEPGRFYVLDTEGPLLETELERAAAWARLLMQAA